MNWATSYPYLDPVPEADDHEGIDKLASQLADTAEIYTVAATGEILAEVPGHRLEFWALGKSEEIARADLLIVIGKKLRQILSSTRRAEVRAC